MDRETEVVLRRLKSKAKYTTEELCSKGVKIYAEIKEKLEPMLNNKFVVIEVDSGDYFIGNDSFHQPPLLVKNQLEVFENIYEHLGGDENDFSSQ